MFRDSNVIATRRKKAHSGGGRTVVICDSSYFAGLANMAGYGGFSVTFPRVRVTHARGDSTGNPP